MPEFHNNWFRSSAIRPWTRKLRPLAGIPIYYLEIGVFQAQSSHWMLENVLTHDQSHAWLVDPWLPTRKIPAKDMDANYELAKANLKPFIDAGKCTIYRELSGERLPKFPDLMFDIIYVDGDHTYEGVKIDAEIGWTKLRPGGIMIFDDYRALRSTDGVTQLVNEWFLKEGHKYDCEHYYETSKHQAFRKPVKSGDTRVSPIADYTGSHLHQPNG